MMNVSRKPVRKMVLVPITIARYSCRCTPGRSSVDANEIHAITAIPARQPVAAAMRLILRGIIPSKNSPNMPPENIDDSFHQASIILSTLSMAMATMMPITPIITLENLSTNTSFFSDDLRLNSL